ncbi:MAG TPA: hypothetical protein VF867_09260 [Arthrobacter sp.]
MMMTPEHVPIFGSVDELVRVVLTQFFAGQNVHVYTLFSENMLTPAIVARRERRSGTLALASRDDRFMQPAIVMISTITDGPDADEMGEELQEMCRYALRQAQQLQVSVPGSGSIAVLEGSTHPAKVADWQTSTSVVQYASLPKNAVRYEAIYRLLIRPPDQNTITNRFKP